MTDPLCTKCNTPQHKLRHYGDVWVCTLCISEDDMKDLRRQVAKIEKFHLRQIERGMGPSLKCRDCSDLIEWDEGTMSPPDYCEACFKLRLLDTLEARIDAALEKVEGLIDQRWFGPESWQVLDAIRKALKGEEAKP